MTVPHPIEPEQREPKQAAPDVVAVLGYIVIGISLAALAWFVAVIVLGWY